MPNYLNCEQAAELAQCSHFLIREAIKSGKLAACKPGKRYLIDPADLDKWIKSRQVKPRTKKSNPA